MSIVARRRSEPAIVTLTGENKGDGFVSGQCLGMVEKVEGRQAPVDAIEAQMLCQPVFQLISPLGRPSTVYPCDKVAKSW